MHRGGFRAQYRRLTATNTFTLHRTHRGAKCLYVHLLAHRYTCTAICLIDREQRAVLFIDMRCDKTGVGLALLLGASVLLGSAHSVAEKPKSQAVVVDWRKGRKLTPTRAETYRLCAGTRIELAPDAQVEVQTKVPLPTSIEGLEPFAYAAQLTAGRVNIAIDTKQKPASGVLIYGPRRTTVLARGGNVSVIAGPNTLAVGVYDGKEASVGIGTAWKHITAGNMLVVSPENPQGVEGKLPAAPANVTVNRPVLSIPGSLEATRAEWAAVTDAKRYFVSLVNTATQTKKDLEATQPHLELAGLDAGRYELRVAAIDAAGLNGPTSAPAFVNVVGVELPAGAFVSQGKIYLESLQQITLTNVDGLEASYDSAPVYFKAANRASLRGTHATTLHLRVPGSTERASLALAPRDLHTQVDILPPMARWPRDKVIVRVQLPKLLALAKTLEVVPSITVNNQELKLEWLRTEQGMETVIPAPPNYPGPWVLRAEVADQHGIVLGRNFLEIASTAGLDDEDLPREIHRGPSQAQAKR